MSRPNILIVGCGWVGTYCAQRFRNDLGAMVTVTTTTPEKQQAFEQSGIRAFLVAFGERGSGESASTLTDELFDVLIVSVPITRKDDMPTIQERFSNLAAFIGKLRFKQAFFFGSVGIYPNEHAIIYEDSYSDKALDQKLLYGETTMRNVFPQFNLLRLGGLFGLERVMAKYFQDKVCMIGYQTANFIHVEDIYGIIRRMIDKAIAGVTYNIVSPDHPLKKDVIRVSAAKYGFKPPSSYDESDQTAKRVSPGRLIRELDYAFIYPSPLDF